MRLNWSWKISGLLGPENRFAKDGAVGISLESPCVFLSGKGRLPGAFPVQADIESMNRDFINERTG